MGWIAPSLDCWERGAAGGAVPLDAHPPDQAAPVEEVAAGGHHAAGLGQQLHRVHADYALSAPQALLDVRGMPKLRTE